MRIDRQRYLLLTSGLGAAVSACEARTPRAEPVVVIGQPSAVAAAPGPPASSAPSAPSASSTTAVVAPDLEGPAPPPKQPIDPQMKVEGPGLLLGINATEVWLSAGEHESLVYSRTSGCAIESFHDPAVLATLRSSKDDATTSGELQRPEVLAALRDVVGFRRRFEVHGDDSLAWTPDGRHVFFSARNESLYHSQDGGRSFARFDSYLSSRLAMSADGKHLVYERCVDTSCTSCAVSWAPGCGARRHYVSLPTDGSRGRDKQAILAADHRPGTLAARKCSLLELVKTP